MPGLLDITDDPNTAGLLSLGLRLMSTPGKFGTALGQAGLGAMGDLQQARQMVEQRRLREQQAKMQGLQMQSLEQQLADAQRARQESERIRAVVASQLAPVQPIESNAASGITGPRPEALSAVGERRRIDPQALLAQGVPLDLVKGLMESPNFGRAKVARTVEVDDGQGGKQTVQLDDYGNRVGAGMPGYIAPVQVNQGDRVTFARPQAGVSMPVAPVSNAATDLLIPGPDGRLVPNVPLIGAKRQVAEAGATRLDINTGENKFATKAAEVMATQLAETYKQGQAATRALGQVNRLDQLLQKTGGGFTPAIKMYAGQFGVNTAGLDDIQAAEAVIQSLIPQQRPPGSGTMSDRDVELFRQSLPRLINQPGGNQKIVNTMRGLYEYDQKLGQISSDALAGKISRDKAMELMNAVPNPLAYLTGGEDIHSQADAIIKGAGNGKR